MEIITSDYTIVPNPTAWAEVTNGPVRLNVDTTLGNVNITMPLISNLTEASNVEIVINDVTPGLANQIFVYPGSPIETNPIVDVKDDKGLIAVGIRGDLIANFEVGQKFATENLSIANDIIQHEISAIFESDGNTYLACRTLVDCEARQNSEIAYKSLITTDRVCNKKQVEVYNGSSSSFKIGNDNNWVGYSTKNY